ncbi:carboxymuconolactone decarboxylase family protein [Maritalea myrionectae]|uniref:carboxymuconolactone decarboxylase family protein n=1 Tax=Maritalea myrionectae TaxID=454601 RepID=UPI00040C0F44|nr:carboxymuconolactone decarboxylase family protein [Maritalea myrionectae]
MSTALERGRTLAAKLNPSLEVTLADRYDQAVPNFAETLIEHAYGRIYAREGLDLKTRQLITIGALTALGGQTAPQLKINIQHAQAQGASKTEIYETIMQMSLYGGLPAAINALNTANDYFADSEMAEPQV